MPERMPGAEARPHRDDEVDLVFDAWSAILPDVDLSPLDVMSRLRRIARHLERVRSRAFREAGLTAGEFEILSALRQLPPPHALHQGELAGVVTVGVAALSHRLSVLATRGLVLRGRASSSGRVLVTLSPTGATLVERAMRELVAAEEVMLAEATRSERAHLITGLRRLSLD